MISCKYLSQILHNTAPARVFDDILAPSSQARHPDWFAAVAPRQHLTLYRSALKLLGLEGMPEAPGELDSASAWPAPGRVQGAGRTRYAG